MDYDVIVIGLGAVGSATLNHLSKRGAAVLGIDRFLPPHKHGSSHGETRITRAAIGEGEEYSPLAIRSHELWRELEKETGTTLYVRCGCLTIAGPNAVGAHDVEKFFENVRSAAAQYSVPSKEFASGSEIREHFPQFKARPLERGFLDMDGGYVFPEACVAAQLQVARRQGAEVLTHTKVVSIKPESKSVRVRVADGREYSARQAIVTAGAWLPGLLQHELEGLVKFTVTRQVLHWFEILYKPESFASSNFPVFIWLPSKDEQGINTDVYGFPWVHEPSEGFKITHEESGGTVDPDMVDRTVSAQEIEHVYETYVQPFFPGIGRRSVRTAVCLYTKVDQGRFVVDAVPGADHILFASACSGHGFKHSAAVGEALAERALGLSSSAMHFEEFSLAALKRRHAE